MWHQQNTELEKTIPDVTGLGLLKKTKLTKLERKIPDVSGLVTISALTAVENKIPDVSSLVKKIDYNKEVSETETKLTYYNGDKYITTSDFNNLAAGVFHAKLAQTSLLTKTDFNAKLTSLDKKTSNKTKHLVVENEFKKLKTFDWKYFIGKNHFEEDGTQNYLVFQPMYRYFKRVSGVGSSNYIYFWKSKGLSEENMMKTLHVITNSIHNLSFFGTKSRVEFNGSCLKLDKITYVHGKVLKIYIVYEKSRKFNNSNYPKLENCLFGAVILTRNADIDTSSHTVSTFVDKPWESCIFRTSAVTGKSSIVFSLRINAGGFLGKKFNDRTLENGIHSF